MDTGVAKVLFVLEFTARLGVVTVAMLAKQNGWNKPTASRYLTQICQLGWLEKVSAKGFPKYVLGHSCPRRLRAT